MEALISTVCGKMGNNSPISMMFVGMMPLIRTKLNEIDEKTLQNISNVMAQAFEKVSDPEVSESDFAEWLKFE